MKSLVISSLLAASALASPRYIGRAEGDSSKAVCEQNPPRTISFNVGPQIGDVLPQICHDLQCGKEVCVETIDYTLNANKTTTYPGVNVQESGNKKGDQYNAWFTVHPPQNPPPTITWTKEDCFNYFNKIATDCASGDGIHPGSFTVVDSKSELNGAMVEITILPNNETQPVVNNH